jgi:NTE family protein
LLYYQGEVYQNTMGNRIAYVLGGGGSRGALQVGAIKALLEVGILPDLLVGTSIGAVNGAYLALHGVNMRGLESLIEAWRDAAQANLLPSNYLWLTVRALFNRPVADPVYRMRDFYIKHGISPGLRFGDLQDIRLIIVAADLNSGCPVLYGMNPDDLVLDGLVASTALPPWVQPLQMQEQLLMDGGVVSNLPIEPALAMGARQIIAMNLMDFRDVMVEENGFGSFLGKLFNIVERRQLVLETSLAEAKGVLVYRLDLLSDFHVPLWRFDYTEELIALGYETARKELTEGGLRSLAESPAWVERVLRIIRQRLGADGRNPR